MKVVCGVKGGLTVWFMVAYMAASQILTKQDVAAIALLGMVFDVLGGLYLAYDLLGRERGVLRVLTRVVAYGACFGVLAIVFFSIRVSISAGVLWGLSSWLVSGVLLAFGACARIPLTLPRNEAKEVFRRVYTLRLLGVYLVGSVVLALMGVLFDLLLAMAAPAPVHNLPSVIKGTALAVMLFMLWTTIEANFPYTEWRLSRIPIPRYGVVGVFLILIGFILQSVQYWLAVLNIPVR